MKTIIYAAGAALALVAGAAQAETRGPDTAGYLGTDQVTYTFNDITQTGTKILGSVDDATQSVSLGMNFTFYGQTYTDAWLSSNGVIMFGAANNQWTNFDLTQGQFTGGPAIFTWWDDLLTTGDANRGVYYQTIGNVVGQRKFVVQEIANHYTAGGQSINFQTVLDEASGDILMRYTQTAFGNPSFDNGVSATIGIQGNQGAGQVVQWSFNQAAIRDNQSLCFTRNANAACNAIADPQAVPEPATWAMLLFGFGGVGYALRRRTSAAPRVRFA